MPYHTIPHHSSPTSNFHSLTHQPSSGSARLGSAWLNSTQLSHTRTGNQRREKERKGENGERERGKIIYGPENQPLNSTAAYDAYENPYRPDFPLSLSLFHLIPFSSLTQVPFSHSHMLYLLHPSIPITTAITMAIIMCYLQ